MNVQRNPMRKTALLLTVGLALAACSANNSFQNGEAGDGIGTKSTGFGTANAQNTAVMSGDQTYAINLTRKFASEVPNTVNFAFNSSALSPQARSALARQASWIRQFPQIRFRVYGYTDLVGSNAYNKALGMRRARAVVQFLETQGISRQRLEAVVSYGETRPLVYTPAPNEANRRAVTEVSGFISGGKPMPMDGKYAEVVYNEYINSAKPAQTIVIKGKDGGGGGGG